MTDLPNDQSEPPPRTLRRVVKTPGPKKPPVLSPVDQTPADPSWEPMDVSHALAHPVVRTPGVLYRADGPGLLYPDLLSSLVAPSGAGKSMVADWICAQQMQKGELAIYLDYDADIHTHLVRLQAMGITRQVLRDQFLYLNPSSGILPLPDTDGTRDMKAARLRASLKRLKARLRDSSVCIIDTKADALVNERMLLKEAEGTIEYLRFMSGLAGETHCTMLLLDHPPRLGHDEGYGSVYNTNVIQGTVMTMRTEPSLPFRKDGVGLSHLLLRKDRHSGIISEAVPFGTTNLLHLAELVLDAENTPMALRIERPDSTNVPTVPQVVKDGRMTDLDYEAKVLDFVEIHQPVPSKTRIVENAGGNQSQIRAAVERLLHSGLLVRDKDRGGFIVGKLGEHEQGDYSQIDGLGDNVRKVAFRPESEEPDDHGA